MKHHAPLREGSWVVPAVRKGEGALGGLRAWHLVARVRGGVGFA